MSNIIQELAKISNRSEVSKRLQILLADSQGITETKNLLSSLSFREAKQIYETYTKADFVESYGKYAIDFAHLEHLAVLSHFLALTLSSRHGKTLAVFLHQFIEDKSKSLLPSVRIIIDSALSMFFLRDTVNVAMVVPMFGEQHLVQPVNERFLGRGFINIKLRELEDLRTINPKFSYRAIFVADGRDFDETSGETTLSLAQSLVESDPALKEKALYGQLMLLEFVDEMKDAIESIKGGAQIYGMHKALEDPETTVVLTTDSPCEVPLSQAGLLIASAACFPRSVTLGSRKNKQSYSHRGRTRKFMSLIYNQVMALILPELRSVSDKQMGYKAWPRNIASCILPEIRKENGAVIYDKSFDYGRTFDTNLLLRAAAAGFGLIEKPSIVISSRNVAYGLRGNWALLKSLPRHRKDAAILQKRQQAVQFCNENPYLDRWEQYICGLLEDPGNTLAHGNWQCQLYAGKNFIVKRPTSRGDIFRILWKKLSKFSLPSVFRTKNAHPAKSVSIVDYMILALWKIVSFPRINTRQFKNARKLNNRLGGIALPYNHIFIRGCYYQVQQRGTALGEYLSSVTSENKDSGFQLGEVWRLVKEAVDLVLSLWKLGIFPEDFQFPHNFAVRNGQLFLTDLGSLLMGKPLFPFRFYRRIWRLWMWEGIGESYPEVFQLYEKLADQLLTKAHLKVLWQTEKGYPVANLFSYPPEKIVDEYSSSTLLTQLISPSEVKAVYLVNVPLKKYLKQLNHG